MPRTIETIKRPTLKEDVLDNHIANTYFYQKTRPKIRKKKPHHYLKDAIRFVIPVLMVSAITAIFIVSIPVIRSKYHSIVKDRIASSKSISIIDRGMINKELIANYILGGSAQKDVFKMAKGSIVLTNPKKYSWADLSLNFNFPINLTKRSIGMSLKGNIGGEKVSVVLRDVNNRSCRINDISLSSKWGDKKIALDGIGKDIDLANINHFRIEYGYVGESAKDKDSPIDVTVYIKNINLPKET